VQFDEAITLWRDGERRLRSADPGSKPALERVTDEIVRELQHRLGGSFYTDELAELYESALDWSFGLATKVAPDTPEAWDVATVTNAAFARYVRSASDWAGGQRVMFDEAPPGR
jgi:hypothetical protein